MTKKKKYSLIAMLKGLFLGNNHMDMGEEDLLKEEELQSPFRTIVKNFFSNKIALTGLIAFSTIFAIVIIYPFLYPIDLVFQNSTQRNAQPMAGYMDMPAELENDFNKLSIGSLFTLGIDNEGNLYQWGELSDKLQELPEDMGKLVDVSAGLDHAVGLDENGMVYSWGNDRLNIGNIPREVERADNISKVYAGHQISMALTDDGHLYNWGNANLIKIAIPYDYQGTYVDMIGNSSTALALTSDGIVVPLTYVDNPSNNVPEEIQGSVVAIELTTQTGMALTNDGYVHFWGDERNNIQEVPEEIQGKVVDISSGYSTFTAVTEDGKVHSWGTNVYGEGDAPNINDAVKITSGSYQNYVETADGEIVTFGLNGYLMGTDHYGRDVFGRLVEGGRMTMTIGAVAVIIQMGLGVLVGGIAGYYGGFIDNILMRFAEVIGAIPFMPLAMILSAVIGNQLPENLRITMIMVILGILSWPRTARLVRGQVLAEREKEFVTAAKSMGIKERVIIFRHIIPNVITVIIVNATLSFAASMITETSLSFLGFGVLEPRPTWGNMLTSSQNSEVISVFWWRWLFPAIALSISTISINLIGDGLRSAIDPKSNER